jgi:phospholipase D1/2
MSQASKIFKPGENCWKIAQAQRAAVLIDAEAYYDALASALSEARRSIFIVGWDIDSRIRLRRGEEHKGFPALGTLLNQLVKEHSDLHAYVLNWDFAMLYALDRELLPVFKFGWNTHRRLQFKLDARHPVGGSHHQKIVVIDDSLAFCGGIDLTHQRWDTPAHRAGDPRRRDNGDVYAPFHDVQMMVSGGAAAALGQLVRQRWERAGGDPPVEPSTNRAAKLWPPQVKPDFEQVNVAVSRTQPGGGNETPVKEVHRLWLDSIAAAQKHILIENQYFTAQGIGAALERRLREESGPEVVVILSRDHSGWLEEATMGVLGVRLIRRLRAADKFDRLRVVCPDSEELGDTFLKVHSKLMIIDDWLLRVGSANLNNRSMGLDSECDLTIEAEDSAARSAISEVRARLLGEHLGLESGEVQAFLDGRASLTQLIDTHKRGKRRLAPLSDEIDPLMEEWVPEGAVVDPERPVTFETLAEMIQVEERSGWHKRKTLFLKGWYLGAVLTGGAVALGTLIWWLSRK